MHRLVLFLALVLTSILAADTVQYIRLDNGYRVWTKRVGHGPTKVLTLHGGPGCSHSYIKTAFEKYFSPDAFEIIYYDQLGSTYSDKPDDVSLWTVERFREEVEQVRKALNLDQFYLYGQSWGGMLAIEYALKYQSHLKGLILSNTPGSIRSYEAYIQKLRDQLPSNIQEELAVYEEKGDFQNPEYGKLMLEEVYPRFLCRLNPWPETILSEFQLLNLVVYNTMQGPNEFQITGNFKNWDRWNDLSKIKVPTLLISGRYDTINPADTAKMASRMPNATFKICENGGHLAMFDDAENYFGALRKFFKDSSKQGD